MKKLFNIISAAIVSTAFIGAAASAATCTGSISTTGPDSNNQITCNELTNIVLTCDNNVLVGTVNTQNGSSGSGEVSNNTSGGNVATGTVVNNNGTNVTIGSSCGLAAQTGNAETPAGGGAGQAGGGQGAAGGIEVLPDTTSTPAATVAAVSVAVAAGVATISRMGVAAYRRFAIK